MIIKSKVEDEDVDYHKLNLRFHVESGERVQIIVHCDDCKGDHRFNPPNGEWSVADIINNMEDFTFGSRHGAKE